MSDMQEVAIDSGLGFRWSVVPAQGNPVQDELTQEKVSKLMEEWVDRLGLQDWDIHLAWRCRPDEIPMSDSLGVSSYVESCKQACIYILDKAYYKGDPFVFDFEITLVHELMHLKVALLSDKNENSMQYRAIHMLIDDMAKALVRAKRSGGSK